jgi:hypothetical protein
MIFTPIFLSLIWRIFPFLIGLGLLFLTTSCHVHRLSVQSQYFTQENLASYHVGTPDPQLNHPSIGQRLLIQWSLSSEEMLNEELILYLKVRFRNHGEEEIQIPLTMKWGTYLYLIKDQKFLEVGGILTYLAEIRSDSCIIASWKHPLWTNLIIFDEPTIQ